MYGIDSHVLPPPLGAVVSLLLLAGCDAIGAAILRRFGFCSSGAPVWHRWQGTVVGAAALATVLYPLALVNLTPLVLMRAVAWLIAAVGLVHTLVLWRAWRQGRSTLTVRAETRTERMWVVLLLILLVGAGLMALAPPTDADSLDYHLGIPVALLVQGGMPVTPEWLHGRLAASHEVLNAVGLAGGTDNFGAVLQFSAMLSIAALLVFADTRNETESGELHRLARLTAAAVALSAPLMVSLVAQKPQLLPSAMTSLALALVVYPSRQALSRREALLGHTLVCLLVLSAAQAKLSFMLTGGIVGLLSLAVLARRGLLLPAAGIGIIAVAVTLLPQAMWKQHYFHDTLVNSLLKTTPGSWPGSAAFDGHLRGSTMRLMLPFPLPLIVPLRLTTVSIVFGPAVVIALTALRPGRDRWLWIILASAGVVSVVMLNVGPKIARYYLEPSVWLLMIFALQAKPPSFIRTAWFAAPLVAQTVFTIALFWFGAVTLFPGALTSGLRSRVMDTYANGYHVMRWADSVLPANAVLLSADRSIALAPRDVVSFDWAAVVPVRSQAARPYLTRLKERGVTHILIGTATRFTSISGCLGPVVAGPGDDPVVVRNPFAEPRTYPEWIYQFKSDQLPECAFARK